MCSVQPFETWRDRVPSPLSRLQLRACEVESPRGAAAEMHSRIHLGDEVRRADAGWAVGEVRCGSASIWGVERVRSAGEYGRRRAGAWR
eukprot:618396-Pleurochrysis_carterae.AAC.1